jgi:hypothetical protein
MEREDRKITRPGLKPPRLLIAALIIIILAGAAALFLAPRAQAAQAQPIDFPHVSMVQAGVNCTFCHSTALRSPAAGMPSVEKCVGCHKVINPNAPEVKKTLDYWNRQEPIPWVRVNILPRFVYFSHEVHVVKGQVNCERCHGDVGHMKIAQPVVRMNMGWCLNCHEKQPDSPKLKDCFVCHQ